MIPDLLMAPLAEITTPALRRIVRSFSKKVHLFSEMLSAASIVKGGFHNNSRMMLLPQDPPFSYQILGNDPYIMGEAVKRLSEKGNVSFDINMGCSAPEIRSRGQGAALLKDMEKASCIIKQCRSQTENLLSVKLRAGIHETDTKNLINFVRMAESEGADFVTIHPRIASQGFSRRADWKVVRDIVPHVSVPVIYNGDINSVGEAEGTVQKSGCAGVMIGRRAVQSPWIFASLEKAKVNTSQDQMSDLYEISYNFVSYLDTYIPRVFHKTRAHRFFLYFSRNFKFGHTLFSKIRSISSPPEMHHLVAEYINRNPHERYVSY